MRPARLLALAALASCLAVAPAAAESERLAEAGISEKLDEVFRDLMDRMEPALDELRETLEIFEKIDDIENYERPEFLPNGDILIRRRPDAPEWEPPEDDGSLRT